MECKKCSNDILVDTIEIVQDINWENEVEVEAKRCTECECIHYTLGDIEVAEFAVEIAVFALA